MSVDDGQLVLQLDLAKGRNADAAIAAESLLAWIDLTRDAARAIDPLLDVKVELLGREEGSLKQLLKLVEDGARTIGEGASEFPYLKKVAIGLASGIVAAGMGEVVTAIVQPAVQEVSLSEKDRSILKDMAFAIQENVEVAKASMRFYRAVEKDPAITGVKIQDGPRGKPLVIVDRSDFAIRGGLYSPESAEAPEETRRETWGVVLMQAPFYPSQKHWGFRHSDKTVNAKMADPLFLQAISDGTVPISLREGVWMEIVIEWKEWYDGKTWNYVHDSRRVVKVLSPLPSAPGPATVDPEEGQQSNENAKGDDKGPPA